MRNQREKTREEMSWWTLHRWMKDCVDSGSGVVRDYDANALWGRIPEDRVYRAYGRLMGEEREWTWVTSHLNVDGEE